MRETETTVTFTRDEIVADIERLRNEGKGDSVAVDILLSLLPDDDPLFAEEQP